ncbi:hypothetical protein PPTG_09864 [Phytophthora nicotianae INRA-310]|uniref:PiggyBac transposable element-derived protein domain-containing protein n=1 Tax=Phytophthora nicotianae (strain INRA-310) TaxID=761204 RepID=W2QD68_PHYN3|nr:hypothetical protein PPTG_09864 [Phytophthora nicotianae INRA-310]ETN10786.1 hypothetical protein PPTG_09864 [Phytophthora nicotianae INRA-310]
MFFYFLPKALWVHIASESDAYRVECIPAVAEMIRKKQLDAQAKDPSRTVQPIADITSKLERVKPIKPHEILHVVGLLAARTLCSHTDGLEKHWSTREDGAFSRGTFSRYMKRERFRIITRYLHFASNSTGGAAHDKAWKVRPVLQAVEKTFRRGYRLGARVSFDEGTIPNRSQFNPIRVYNKDKPHKYGTKCYMTCCAETGYCSRVEVYLGKAKDKKQAKGVAQKAVIRNLAKSFDGQPRKRLIIADNFYSSCALALELRDMGFYYVGTHRNDRLGWPKSLEFKQKKRPAYMPRGTYRIAQDVDHPELVAVAWMDSSPVHMIAIGCSTIPTSVTRRDKATGGLDRVPCPQLIADYHADLPSRRRNLALQFIDVNNESSTSDGASIESGLEGNAPAVGGLDVTVEATQDDPNITPETDDPSAYTQFESDGENDEGDDEMSSVDGDDEADMQLPVPQKCISKVV